MSVLLQRSMRRMSRAACSSRSSRGKWDWSTNKKSMKICQRQSEIRSSCEIIERTKQSTSLETTTSSEKARATTRMTTFSKRTLAMITTPDTLNSQNPKESLLDSSSAKRWRRLTPVAAPLKPSKTRGTVDRCSWFQVLKVNRDLQLSIRLWFGFHFFSWPWATFWVNSIWFILPSAKFRILSIFKMIR